MTSTVVYGVVAIILAMLFFGNKVYSKLIDEIADLRDELSEERGRLSQIIQQKDAEYKALAEARDTTKIEDTMTTIQRDLEAQHYRHEQEMGSSFEVFKLVADNLKELSSNLLVGTASVNIVQAKIKKPVSKKTSDVELF